MSETPGEIIRRANDAARLLGEISPHLDEIERDAMEAALSAKWWHPFGWRTTRRHLERVMVIRDLKSRIETVIQLGKHADYRQRMKGE